MNSRNTALPKEHRDDVALGASVRGKERDFDLKVAPCVNYARSIKKHKFCVTLTQRREDAKKKNSYGVLAALR